MSDLRWCDVGSHAYPVGADPDEREYAETRVRDDQRKRIHCCGPCYRNGASSVAKALIATEAKAVEEDVDG
jgi:hypothetical protein